MWAGSEDLVAASYPTNDLYAYLYAFPCGGCGAKDLKLNTINQKYTLEHQNSKSMLLNVTCYPNG